MTIYFGFYSWFEVSESIIHVHGEDDVRQVVAKVVVEEEDDIWTA